MLLSVSSCDDACHYRGFRGAQARSSSGTASIGASCVRLVSFAQQLQIFMPHVIKGRKALSAYVKDCLERRGRQDVTAPRFGVLGRFGQTHPVVVSQNFAEAEVAPGLAVLMIPVPYKGLTEASESRIRCSYRGCLTQEKIRCYVGVGLHQPAYG